MSPVNINSLELPKMCEWEGLTPSSYGQLSLVTEAGVRAEPPGGFSSSYKDNIASRPPAWPHGPQQSRPPGGCVSYTRVQGRAHLSTSEPASSGHGYRRHPRGPPVITMPSVWDALARGTSVSPPPLWEDVGREHRSHTP